MKQKGPSRALQYSLAIVVTVAAVGLRWLLNPYLQDFVPFVTLFAAVAASVWFGGIGPGLVSTIGGYIACDYLFVFSQGQTAHIGLRNFIAFFSYLLTCFIIISLGEAMRRAKNRAAGQAETLNVTLGSIGDGVISTDTDGNITFMNSVAESLTGWKATEVQARPIHEIFRIVHEDTRRTVENPAVRSLNSGTVTALANHSLLIARDGSEIPIDDSGSPIKDSKGEILGAVLVFRDIRERQKADRIRAQLAEIVKSSDDAIISKNLDGNITSWNAGAERLFEFSAEEAIGRPISIIIPLEKLEEEEEILARLRKGEHIDHFETVRISKSGRVLDISISVSAMRNPSGEIIGISKIARSVSDRKRTELDLYEGRERLRMALEAGQMGSWTRELDESDRVQWSMELERIFGLEPGEFSQTEAAFLEFVFPDDRETIEHAVATAIQNHTDYEVEFRYRRKGDPAIRWMIGRGRAFYDASGKPYRLAGLGWDVTERKRAEEERAQLLAREQFARTEAESANQAKDTFIATASHELRTPLNAIFGWIHLLKAGNLDNAKRARAIEAIQQSAAAQSRLIEDLLDVSRISSGKLQLDLEPVSMIEILENSIETLKPSAEQKSIQIVTDFQPINGSIIGDATRLKQIAWNLLSNAIKFSEKGGTVEVQLRQMNFMAQIRVKDYGIGVEPDFLPHLFERFRQADANDTRKHGGLGLGLSLVQHLVLMHGGEVFAQSPGLGKGATFTVQLPIRTITPDKVKDHQSHELSKSALAGSRVLVVEDEQNSREILATVLSDCGAAITAVATAAEAYEAMQSERPELLISDIGLPGENGYELIKKIRKLPPQQGGHVPAVAVTAYARAEDRRRALTAGFQAHISKPVDPAELVHLLAKLLRKSSASLR